MKRSVRARQRRAVERQIAREGDRFKRLCIGLTTQAVDHLSFRRKKECLSKTHRFRTKRDAERYKYLMRRRWKVADAFFLVSYECVFCLFWHLGHPNVVTVWNMLKAIKNNPFQEAS